MRVGSIFGESPVYIRLAHLHYMAKVLSCQFSEYCDKSKFMGNNRNNIETPPGRVAGHLAEIHISYQHIIILRASYIMVS